MLFENFAAKLDEIYERQGRPNKIIIALSGGIDSMALLHLYKTWALGKNLKIIALTVDHRLRAESEAEAKEIALLCGSIGIEHHILTWQHQGILSDIQQQARKARYKLITSWCIENQASLVLTAHHLGDQLEQLLISLTQGAGIYSFTIPSINRINNINFARPLLEISKDELLQYLNENKIKWWEDSSNDQPKYLRNIVRPLSDQLLKIAEKKRVITSFANLERATKALTRITQNYIKSYVSLSKLGYLKFDIQSYLALDEEIRFSALRHFIITIGRQDSDLRLDSLAIIDDAIKQKKLVGLGGCSFFYSGQNCIVIRDFGRKMPEKFEGAEGIWDNRFKVKAKVSCNISYCPEEKINKILKDQPNLLDFDKEVPKNIKKNIIRALPAILHLEKLVGIPHIYYYDCDELVADMQIEFIERVV